MNKQDSVQFAKTTAKEDKLINAVIDRAEKEGLLWDDRISLEMDLCAVHFHTPLDFERLADPKTEYFDFAHDIAGIQHHINRDTGLLENHFLPRFALQQGGQP